MDLVHCCPRAYAICESPDNVKRAFTAVNSLFSYPCVESVALLKGGHGLSRILIDIEDLIHAGKREYL